MKQFQKLSRYEKWIHLLLYLIGVVFMPMGVVLTIKSDLGVGGYDALNFALAQKLQIRVSFAIYLTALMVVFLTALIRKSFPRITTFIASFFLGIFTDIWEHVFFGLYIDGIIGRVTLLFLGILIISISVAAYVISVLPCNPTDDFVVALTERGVKLSTAKLGLDCCCVLVAIVLKGEIGFGTIACTFFIGPCVDWFQVKIRNFQNKWFKSN